MRVQSVDAGIAANRAHADACLRSLEVTREFCGQLLAMSRLINFLVEAAHAANRFACILTRSLLLWFAFALR